MSVCLTTFKRGHILAKSLDSILSQTYRDFELIISDDNSPDHTPELCRRYAAQDERVRYFRNATTLGMPGNLNAAIAHARGDYIANLHDGDTFRPDLLEHWVRALDQHPTAAFVFNALDVVDYAGNPIHAYRHSYPPLIPGRILLDQMLSQWNSPVWGTVMARRACYEAVGPFDPRFGFISDIDMWMRLAARYDVAYVGEPLIQITPREVGHRYASINWEIHALLVAIHHVNLERRYADSHDALRAALRRMRWRRDRAWIRDLLVCLKHKRSRELLQGLQAFRASDSVLLRVLGTLAKPWEALVRTQGDRPGQPRDEHPLDRKVDVNGQTG